MISIISIEKMAIFDSPKCELLVSRITTQRFKEFVEARSKNHWGCGYIAHSNQASGTADSWLTHKNCTGCISFHPDLPLTHCLFESLHKR